MTISALNEYLSSRSFIVGYAPTSADVELLNKLGNCAPSDVPHVLRWFNQIKSYEKQESDKFPRKELPKDVLKIVSSLGNKGAVAAKDDNDDDVDLFGSEEEDAEAEKIKEERLKAYAERKSKKPTVIAKSNVILDVKPWDDETDMKELEKCVRSIKMDGLLWGASKLVPVGYGIMKLQISSVIEDDKVSVDDLTEKIQEFEDYIQSVDIAAFNKI